MVSSISMALLSGKSNGALSPESPPSPGSSPAERELPYHRFRVPPEPYTIRDLSLWASRRATLLHCLWRLKNSSRRLSKSLPLRDLGALLVHLKSKAQVRRAGSIARQPPRTPRYQELRVTMAGDRKGFRDDGRVTALALVFLFLTPLFLIVRFWSRMGSRRGLGLDDLLILVSFVSLRYMFY
ncbi:hypothetical protein E4U34_005430 [Claviceps purpurea]|nr:hypothetical protein E4U11_006959 [Claviceps purpurea]KAG6215840.1 hypothetical protein E4U34_005430 [Claviceps purpurea]